MQRLGYFSLLLFLIASCQSERTEIIDRWDNGAKKTVVTYQGEGDDEILLEEKIYRPNGQLFKLINSTENDTTLFPDQPSIGDSLIGKWVLVQGYKLDGITADGESWMNQSKMSRIRNDSLTIFPDNRFKIFGFYEDKTEGFIFFKDGKHFIIDTSGVKILQASIQEMSSRLTLSQDGELEKRNIVTWADGGIVSNNKGKMDFSKISTLSLKEDTLTIYTPLEYEALKNLYVKVSDIDSTEND